MQSFGAQQKPVEPAAATPTTTKAQQDVISLSKEKWWWMSERNIDALSALFHEDAAFVHMGATMSRSQELDVIKSGGIHYKQADIQEVSVKIIGTTAILLNKIRLVAVVGGNEVTNPFVVTEVYVQQAVRGSWARSRSPDSSDNSDGRIFDSGRPFAPIVLPRVRLLQRLSDWYHSDVKAEINDGETCPFRVPRDVDDATLR